MSKAKTTRPVSSMSSQVEQSWMLLMTPGLRNDSWCHDRHQSLLTTCKITKSGLNPEDCYLAVNLVIADDYSDSTGVCMSILVYGFLLLDIDIIFINENTSVANLDLPPLCLWNVGWRLFTITSIKRCINYTHVTSFTERASRTHGVTHVRDTQIIRACMQSRRRDTAVVGKILNILWEKCVTSW